METDRGDGDTYGSERRGRVNFRGLSGTARWASQVLFPQSAPNVILAKRTALGHLAGFASALTYLLAIPAGRSHLTRIWGEDGVIFLQDSFAGDLAPVVTPYAGYLHVLPRLSAEVVSHLPLAWWAAGLAVAAAVLRAALSVLVYSATTGHLRSRTLRLIVAAAVVVLPAGNNEALNNLANLHWFVFFAAFWTLLWRPSRGWQVVVATLVLPLMATTTPVGVLLAPIAVARLLLPQRRDRVPATAYLFGLAAALVPIIPTGRPHQSPELIPIMTAAAARGPLVTFLGPELASDSLVAISRKNGWLPLLIMALATVAVAVLAGVAIVRGGNSQRVLVMMLVGYGSAMLFLSLRQNWTPGLRFNPPNLTMSVERYSTTPCLFFLTAVVVGLAETFQDRVARYAIVAARVMVGAMVTLGMVYQWGSDAAALSGITWEEARAIARVECANGEETVAVTTIPESRTFVRVPCRQLG
jgi:hypothetical protein